MPNAKVTKRQLEVLEAAAKSSDGWINRGASRIWGIAPTAVHACARKGYLAMTRGSDRARLTPAGQAFIERQASR